MQLKAGLLGFLQFLLAVLLIPAVAVITLAFHREMTALIALYDVFLWGAASYVFMHLFIFTPQGLYHFWQRIFADLFRFNGFLAETVPLVVPLLSTLILLVFYIINTFFKAQLIPQVSVFMVGFTFALHVVLTAQDLYEQDSNPLKPRYLFSLIVIFIINLFLLVTLLQLSFEMVSVQDFFRQSLQLLEETYLFLQDRFVSG